MWKDHEGAAEGTGTVLLEKRSLRSELIGGYSSNLCSWDRDRSQGRAGAGPGQGQGGF